MSLPACTVRLALALVLALPACAQTSGGQPPGAELHAPSDCRVERVADIPVRDVAHFLVAPGAIEGTPVSFLLDTGAEGGLVAPEIAGTLRLPLDPARATLMHGAGGSEIGRNVLIRHLQVGGLLLDDASLPVGRLAAAPRLAPPVAGLIGADVLSRFDVELDVPRGRVSLHTVAGCAAGYASLPAPYGSAPLLRRGDRLAVRVVLDGVELEALLDTGALSTIVSPEAAARAGVTPAELARDPGGIGGGVGERRDEFHWHRFHALGIGDETERNRILTVSPLDGEEMLLGNDWLLARHVWISWSGARLYWRK